jgi:hypothetical protein
MKLSKLLASIVAIAPYLALSTASFAEEGAKGLYFDQLSKPKLNINTGVQYWIELHRGPQVLRVNNKTSFQSGDKIAFHLRPNIDGYAYIVLKSGSRGEQSVLFPDAKSQEDNKVQSGKEVVLPSDGMLAFDKNPGIEKLSVILSRTPIDAQAYINPPAAQEAATPPNNVMAPNTEKAPNAVNADHSVTNPNASQLVATADIGSGSKDLVPTQILVSYNEPSSPVSPVKVGSHENGTATPKVSLVHRVHNTAKRPATTTLARQTIGQSDPGIVTVVYKEPSGILAVDVALMHR